MNNWKSFSSIGLSTIFLGTLHKYIYYQAFDVKIFDFVSLSETLTLFDEFLPVIILLILVCWLIIPLIINRPAKELEQTQNYSSNENLNDTSIGYRYIPKDGYFKRLGYHLTANWKSFFLVLIITPLLFNNTVGKTPSGTETFKLLVWFPATFILINYLSDELLDRYSRISRKQIRPEYSFLSNFSALLISSFVVYNIAAIKYIYWNDNDRSIYYFVDNTIKTTSSVKFLGKTENYYFFRTIDKNKTFILPAGDLKSIEIKKIKNKID